MLKKTLQFPVIYQEDPDGGYIATVPVLPGCHTQGKTIEQAEERIKEAIDAYLESQQAHRETIKKRSKVFLGSVLVSA